MHLPPGLRRCLVVAAVATVVTACARPADVAVAPADLPLPTVPARDLAAVAPDGPTMAGSGAHTTAPGDDPSAATDAGTPGIVDESALAAARAGSGDHDWRLLAGFQGTRWSTTGHADVRVLSDTVAVRDGVAVGLVRNERAVPVGPVVVAVGDESAQALLPVLRPGEPAPFEVVVGDGVDVDDLDWEVTAPEAVAAPSRDVELATFWQRGIEDPRPADTYLYPDVDGHPMVVFGEAAAFGPVDGLTVVAAWIGADGRLVGATEGIVADPGLGGGEASDFVVVEDGPADLDSARLMLWATGS